METESECLMKPNGQRLDADVCLKDDQDVKIEHPVESNRLHSNVCVQNEQEMKNKYLVESNNRLQSVCVEYEQDVKIKNPVESYGLHTDARVKKEPGTADTDTENPVDLYVHHRSDDVTKIEPEEVLPHPKFYDVVNVKCEEEMNAEFFSEPSLKETQNEAPCHDHESDGCEMKMGDDESVPSLPAERGSQTGQFATDLSRLGSDATDDSKRSSLRTRVWELLEENGFVSAATESVADEIVEILMTGTLESPDQLGHILGMGPSSEDTGLNPADNQDVSANEKAMPELEIDVADGVEVGDVFPCDRCNLAFPTEEFLQHHFDRLHCEGNNSRRRKRRKKSLWTGRKNKRKKGLAPSEGGGDVGEKLGTDDVKNGLKDGDDDTTKGDEDANKDSPCDLSGTVNGGKSNQGEHVCTVCNKSLVSRSSLWTHLKSHTGDKPYKCTLCCRRFGYSSNLQKHIKTIHDGRKPYKCAACGKTFSQRNALRTHITTVHDKVKPHKCTVCFKAFGERNSLRKHVRIIHEGIKSYKCRFCCKAYGDTVSLRSHLITVHKGIDPYKCTVCCKEFSFNSCLKTHMRYVHGGVSALKKGDNRHKCLICCKAYRRNYHLQRHMRIIHEGERPYKCVVCCEAFGRRYCLQIHMRTVHGGIGDGNPNAKTGDKPYKCTVCHIGFGTRGNMKVHIRTVHDGDKPHKCTVCDKAFGQKSCLKTHIRVVHEGDKPHKCTVCFKAFGRTSDRQKHMRNVHGAEKRIKIQKMESKSGLKMS